MVCLFTCTVKRKLRFTIRNDNPILVYLYSLNEYVCLDMIYDDVYCDSFIVETH